jgi:hypothetical protein
MQICNQVTFIGLDKTAHEEAIPENIRLMFLERLVWKYWYIIIGLQYSLGAGINQSGQWPGNDMVDRDSIFETEKIFPLHHCKQAGTGGLSKPPTVASVQSSYRVYAAGKWRWRHHLSLDSKLRIRGTIPPSPNASPWHGT